MVTILSISNGLGKTEDIYCDKQKTQIWEFCFVIEHRCLLVLVDMLVARIGVRSVRYSLNWMDYGVIIVGKI